MPNLLNPKEIFNKFKQAHTSKFEEGRILFGETHSTGECIYFTLPVPYPHGYFNEEVKELMQTYSWYFGFEKNSWSKYSLRKYLYAEQYTLISLEDDFKLRPEFEENQREFYLFLDLCKAAYTLTDMAALAFKGSAGLSTRKPCLETLKNLDQWEHINLVQLPAVFKELEKVLETLGVPLNA